MDEDLLAAYRRTTYSAETPFGVIRLRSDEPSAELAALLQQYSATEWAFITACNPGSRQLSVEENARRQEELQRMLNEAGRTFFPGLGTGDDGRWPPEPSLLVLGLDAARAKQLGRAFGQNAILVGGADGVPRLAWCGT